MRESRLPISSHDRSTPRASARLLLVLTASVLSLAPSVALTETISYGRVSLEVSKISRAGPGVVKVEQAGEAFLVSEDDAARRVALRMMRSSDHTAAPPFDTFEALLREALERKDIDVARAAITLGLMKPEYERLDDGVLWQVVATTDVGRRALIESLKLSGRDGVSARVCRALVLVREYGSADERTGLENLHLALSDRCLESATMIAARVAVLDGDIAGARRSLAAARDIFGVANVASRDQSARVSEDLSHVAESVEFSDVDRFYGAVGRLRAVGAGDALRGAAPEELFLRVAIEKERAGAGLTAIARLDFERRTPKIHGFVSQVVRSVAVGDYPVVVDPSVADALGRFAQKDEEIASSIHDLVARLGAELARVGRLDEGSALLERYTALGGAPRISADVIAERLARAYLARGEQEAARGVVRRWIPRPSVSLRLDLFLSRVGLSWRSLAILLVCGLLGGALLRKRRVEEKSEERPASSEQSNPSDSAAADEEPLASEAHVDQSNSTESSEYGELLRFFGLDMGASLSEIKHAYRVLVKECHPDLNPHASDHERARFIDLTQRYERLLELIEKETTFV